MSSDLLHDIDATVGASHDNADDHLPALPYPRMPIAQRAKIFIPFNPLKGFQEALREKEKEAEEAYRM